MQQLLPRLSVLFSLIIVLFVLVAPFIIPGTINPDYPGYKAIYEMKGAWLGDRKFSLFIQFNSWHSSNFSSYEGFRLVIHSLSTGLFLVLLGLVFHKKKYFGVIVGLALFSIFFTRNVVLLRESLSFLIFMIGVLIFIFGRPKNFSKLTGIIFLYFAPLFHVGILTLLLPLLIRKLLYLISENSVKIILIAIIGTFVYAFYSEITSESIRLIGREAADSGWSLFSLMFFTYNCALAYLIRRETVAIVSLRAKEIMASWHVFVVFPALLMMFLFRTFEIPTFVLASVARAFDMGLHAIVLIYLFSSRKISLTMYIFLLLLFAKSIFELRHFNF